MRKITYLVAPLMVLPFLVGCNKDTTYKVSVLKPSETTAVHLRFLSEDGTKDLTKDQVRAKKGESFKFRIEADQVGEVQYTVAKDLVFVAVNDEVLFDGVEIYWDGENAEEDRTKATVIVEASKITGDIVVGAEKAGLKDHYTFDYPFLLNLKKNPKIEGDAIDKDNDGYYWTTKPLTVTFEIAEGKESEAEGLGALIDIDGLGYDAPEEYLGYTGISFDTSKYILTIDPGTAEDPKVVPQESFSIVARATGLKDEWLNSFEWKDIKEVSDLGLAPKLFAEGDQKTFMIGKTEYSARIIGFNHDTLVSDKTKKAGITFQFTNVLTNTDGTAINKAWGTGGTVHQNFIESDFNKNYLNDITEGATSVINMLPPDLKEVIAPVVKKVGVYADKKWTATEYESRLFPLAYEEIKEDKSSFNVDEEGTIYSYFKIHNTNNDRKLAPVKGTNAVKYWLRSPSKETGTGQSILNYAFEILADGSIGYQIEATAERGVAPCFCI